MLQNFKIVSYYTPNYQSHAINLINSLKQNKLDYYVHEIKDLGSWKENTNYKPYFIWDCLVTFRKPVLWIDCDAIVHSNLEYFNKLKYEFDIAFHRRKGKELLSGTVWFNDSIISHLIIHEWMREIEINSNIWDQYNLDNTIKTLCSKYKNTIPQTIHLLPAEYCCIYDLMRRSKEVKDFVHIEHFQASRKFNPNHPFKR